MPSLGNMNNDNSANSTGGMRPGLGERASSVRALQQLKETQPLRWADKVASEMEDDAPSESLSDGEDSRDDEPPTSPSTHSFGFRVVVEEQKEERSFEVLSLFCLCRQSELGGNKCDMLITCVLVGFLKPPLMKRHRKI